MGLFDIFGLAKSGIDAITSISNAISNTKIAAINATTEQERVAATERAAGLEAQRDVLVEDAKHSKIDQWIRLAYSAGPIFILNKIYFYDKIFDGTTILSAELWNVIYITLGFFFVHAIVRK